MGILVFLRRRRRSVVVVAAGADGFNRANSATLGTSPASGVWADLTAGFGITSNQAVSSTAFARAALTLTVTNATIEATNVTNVAASYILFRAVDNSNFLRFGGQTVSGALVLQSFVAATITTLVTTTTNMAAGQRWRVVTSGDNITLFVDGVQVGATTSTTFNTAVKFGIQGGVGTIFDDWSGPI